MATRPDTRLAHRQVYERARAYVTAHHAEQLTLEDVARHTMTSTRQLQRILGEEDTSFRRLLLRARMACAAARLLQTDAPVGEIALEVGYVEAAPFSKAFRSCFGCTPSAFRKRRAASVRSASAPAVLAA